MDTFGTQMKIFLMKAESFFLYSQSTAT